MGSFDRVKLQHPIAADLFVFLRHRCSLKLMNRNGFVPIRVCAQELGYSIEEIVNCVPSFNSTRTLHQQLTIDDDGEGTPIIKANAGHSIRKVCNLPKFIPKPDSFGYVVLRYPETYDGSDLYPRKGRNDIMIRFMTTDQLTICNHSYLRIDLAKLSTITQIYRLDSTGVMVREKVPACCMTLHKN